MAKTAMGTVALKTMVKTVALKTVMVSMMLTVIITIRLKAMVTAFIMIGSAIVMVNPGCIMTVVTMVVTVAEQMAGAECNTEITR